MYNFELLLLHISLKGKNKKNRKILFYVHMHVAKFSQQVRSTQDEKEESPPRPIESIVKYSKKELVINGLVVKAPCI